MSEFSRTKEAAVAIPLVLALGLIGIAGCSSPDKNNKPGPVAQSSAGHRWIVACTALSPETWTAVPIDEMNTPGALSSIPAVADRLHVPIQQVEAGKYGHASCTQPIGPADIEMGTLAAMIPPGLRDDVESVCAPVGWPNLTDLSVVSIVCPGLVKSP